MTTANSPLGLQSSLSKSTIQTVIVHSVEENMVNQKQQDSQAFGPFDFNPPMLPIDDRVDVKQRLNDLHQWETEQNTKDQQLQDRLMELERELGSTQDRRQSRLIEQKQNLIGIWRKRNLILQVKIPFAISEEAATRIGYTRLFNHLANQYAGLTKQEKELWLNNLHFLVTPDVHVLVDRLALILRRTAKGEQRNLLIGGDSGSGKTRFLEWIAGSYMPSVESERNYVPVILVEAIKDDKTTKSILQSMILACGANYLQDDNVNDLFNKIGRLFQISDVKLAMVDELNHLTDITQRRRLLEISNRTLSTSIVGAAVDPLQFRIGSPEIQGRFIDFYRLDPYKGDRLSSLLLMLELLLPFSKASNLSSKTIIIREGNTEKQVKGPATIIEEKTKGSFRYIMRLLRDATDIAIQRELPNLTIELLEETWQQTQSSNPDTPLN